MANITLVNAAQAGAQITTRYGNTYSVDANGFVSVKQIDVGDLVSGAGFVFGGANTVQSNNPEKNTAITTAGAGTLTAAALVGAVITRSGPTGAYTDTTDTATAIIAAIEGAAVSQAWEVTIKNTVAFTQTLAAGTGVTLSGQTVIPPNSVGRFLLTYTGAAAVSMQGLAVVPLTTAPLLVSTALNTVGAGTITAAGIVGGLTARGGAQSSTAFTDTTDTAANIIAALPNVNVGQSFWYTYQNTTNAPATIAGGTNVTVSGDTIVPAGAWCEFLVTVATSTTVTVVGIAQGPLSQLPNSQVVTNAGAGATTASVGDLTGAAFVNLILTAVGAANYTTRTGAQMVGDIPNAYIGFSWMIAVRNTNAGTTTVVAGASGVTINGTATIAQNVTRLFQAQITASNTIVLQSMGILAAGA